MLEGRTWTNSEVNALSIMIKSRLSGCRFAGMSRSPNDIIRKE